MKEEIDSYSITIDRETIEFLQGAQIDLYSYFKERFSYQDNLSDKEQSRLSKREAIEIYAKTLEEIKYFKKNIKDFLARLDYTEEEIRRNI